MFRSTLSVLRPASRVMTSRLYSSAPKPASLTAQVFPLEKDTITESDVDEWLQAVEKLKKGKGVQVTTPTEVYLSQMTHPETFTTKEFEPTPAQQAEADAVSDIPIPEKHQPVVQQFTNMFMRHGRRSKAEKVMQRALYMVYLRTRQNPVELLVTTVDRLAPVVTTRVEKTGFAKNRVVPVPLTKKQRYRMAMSWILEGASKKKSNDAAVRLAEEIVSAYEGKSSGYDKLAQMHRQAMQQRAYIKF